MGRTEHDVLVVGGGNAGISLAARVLREGTASDVAVVEPNSVHRYRPLLNYVGSGEATMRSLERPMAALMPKGSTWVRDHVVAVDPAGSTVTTGDGSTIGWSTLVLCPGMVEDWGATPGLEQAYADGWAGSTFVPSSAAGLWSTLRSLRSGRVVFTVPPEPAPCGATALKPLFMACDHWRRTGVLADLEVQVVVPGGSVLGQPSSDEILTAAFSSYGVEVLLESRVTDLDGDRNVTVRSPAGSRTLRDVAFAHVVPHYRAPQWIADSGLAGGSAAGLVDIDPETLRHRRRPSVWSIGDAAGVATRPSGGALRPQVEVLAHNLAAAARGQSLQRYDGYTVMPITVSRRELMLLEVDRDGGPKPSMPFPDLTRPRRLTWWFDRYALKVVYFRRILRGKV